MIQTKLVASIHSNLNIGHTNTIDLHEYKIIIMKNHESKLDYNENRSFAQMQNHEFNLFFSQFFRIFAFD